MRNSRRRRRWLVITSSFPRDGRDLAGHFVREWCRSLTRRGHDVDVLCWRGPSATSRRIEEGLDVRFVPYGPPAAEQLFFGDGAPENIRGRPWTKLLAAPAAISMVAAALRACRRTDYDGVVGHWLVPGGLIARLVGGLASLPSAIVGHSAGVHLLDRLARHVGTPLGRWLVDGPVTVPTAALRKKLVGVVGQDSVGGLEVAPMGYRPGPETVEPSAPPAKELTVGFLGRLVPIKGLPTVLQAVERLRDRGLTVELDVVGAGPRRRAWEEEAGPGIEFLGPMYGERKWSALRRWDGLVVPSKPRADGRHEGLPVSLLEGASAGAVPLVSGVPGVERWLASPERQIVAAGDVDGWVKALRWLATMGEDRRDELMESTRRRVASLAWPEYGSWWEEWLEDAVGSTRPEN